MKNIRVLSIVTTLTIWLIVIMTIWSERSESFKDVLTQMTGHHWVTKGVLSLIFFFGLYLILAKSMKDYPEAKAGAGKVVLSTVVGGVIIFGYFIWHFLG